MQKFMFPLLCLSMFHNLSAQNVGIGIAFPEAKLHVNGDLQLLAGDAVSKFSRDSLFSENSHNNVPTEKAIKDFVQKGFTISF